MSDALGLEMGRPLQVMREYVAVLRAALRGQVEHAGTRYRVSWKSALPTLPQPPPLLIAGLSSGMLELAGEIADGVILWLCAPAYVRSVVVPAVARGRAKGGKPLEGFEIVAAVPVALAGDAGAVILQFKEELTRYLSLPFYRAMITASGFGDALAAYDRDRASRSSPAAAVPDPLVAALGGIGDRRVVHECVSAYRQAGVTLPAIRPIGFPDAPHYRRTLEALAS
jgi:alkanesulfonate monooxygenase SsuD/methylene tetrahydromethanopterin reductase-like flavin-dependent oxidoreductase (luciferase family)